MEMRLESSSVGHKNGDKNRWNRWGLRGGRRYESVLRFDQRLQSWVLHVGSIGAGIAGTLQLATAVAVARRWESCWVQSAVS